MHEFLSSKDINKIINDIRVFCIAQSSVRSANYQQAYEHTLLQHLIENIKLINSGSDYLAINDRNSIIEHKFEYIELVERVSIIMFKKTKDVAGIMNSVQKIFKSGIVNQKYEYLHNFLIEISCISPELQGHLLSYYKHKLNFL